MDDIQDEVGARLFKELVRFVHWVSAVNEVRGHWMLSRDDIEGEAWYAVARCIEKYKDKDEAELLVICRTSIMNAVRTLKYKGLQTYRKEEYYAESFDSEAGVYIPSDFDTELLMESGEWVCAFMQTLQPLEDRIVRLLFGDAEMAMRVRMYVTLRALRSQTTSRSATIKLTPEIISRVLCEDPAHVRRAMASIRKKVRSSKV